MAKGEHHKPSQNELVLKYMREFGTINPLQAIRDLGVYRLTARISDLRSRGHTIIDEWMPVTNRWGKKGRVKKYRLGERGTADD